MAITKRDPNTVYLAGPITRVDEFPAGEAITPGHLIELYDDSGTMKWRKHATSTEQVTLAVALEQGHFNLGVDDAYAAGDQVVAGILCPGSTFWGLIASGQDISSAELMQSAGAGLLKAATATTAAANVAKFQSLDNPGAVTELTRLRVQVIQ